MGERTSRKVFNLNSLKPLADKITSQFPDNRLFFIIAGSLFLFLVAGGITSLIIAAGRSSADQALTEENQPSAINGDELIEQAEVLPQQIREDENFEESDWTSSPMTDPFGGPMRVTGIVTGGRGGPMAIVESSGTSYIVAEGDYVDDLWTVYEVTRDVVILRAHSQEVSLFLDQPPTIRDLNQRVDLEDDEPDDDAQPDDDDPEEGE